MTATLLFLVTFLTLFALSAYSSSAETALFSLPETKVRLYAKSKERRKYLIAKLLGQSRDLLVTVFMLNVCVNVLIQNVMSAYFGEDASWLWKVGVPLIIVLIFGEVIPKYIGLQQNVEIAGLVAPSINKINDWIAPLRTLVVRLTAPISRALFYFLKPEQSIPIEGLQMALQASKDQGILSQEESELLFGYLNLQESTVRELMRPREDVLYYNLDESLSRLQHLFVDKEVTRLPVCEDGLDEVMGIITAQAYFFKRDALKISEDLRPLLNKPLFVPENTPAKLLLRRFQEESEVIALVVDEYGSVTGLITKEDLVEVVIGEISDQRDQKSLYTKSGPNEIIASGKMELEELNELFQTDLASENHMVTVGGWLTEQIGDIPKNGAKYKLHDYVFHVLSAEPTRINRLFIAYRPHDKRGRV